MKWSNSVFYKFSSADYTDLHSISNSAKFFEVNGGPSENRTRTPVRIQVFETCASTNSAKGPSAC